MEHTQFAAILFFIMVIISFIFVHANRRRQRAFRSYAQELYRRERLMNQAAEMKKKQDSAREQLKIAINAIDQKRNAIKRF